jgi:biofilm PGA synthesis lipoprotein PgaB
MDDGGIPVSPEDIFRLDESRTLAPVFSTVNCRPAFWEWASWKNRRLLELSRELMAASRELRPDLLFAVNLYYETILNPRMALAWYGQDLKAARDYPFNYFSLMSYHRQIERELSLTGDEAIDALAVMSRRAVDEVGTPEKIIMKIQSLDWQTQRLLPRKELDRALAAAAPADKVSLAFVRSRRDPPLDIIRKHFRGQE